MCIFKCTARTFTNACKTIKKSLKIATYLNSDINSPAFLFGLLCLTALRIKIIHRIIFICAVAGVAGLEPRLTESESAVLPLDDIPIVLSLIYQLYLNYFVEFVCSNMYKILSVKVTILIFLFV